MKIFDHGNRAIWYVINKNTLGIKSGIAQKITRMTTGTVMRLWPRFYRQQAIITMH